MRGTQLGESFHDVSNAAEVHSIVKSAVAGANPYFVKSADPIARKGISTEIQLSIALPQIAYGYAYDRDALSALLQRPVPGSHQP